MNNTEHDPEKTSLGNISMTAPRCLGGPPKVWCEINHLTNVVTIKAAGDGFEMSWSKRCGPAVGGERFFSNGEIRTFCRLAGVDTKFLDEEPTP